MSLSDKARDRLFIATTDRSVGNEIADAIDLATDFVQSGGGGGGSGGTIYLVTESYTGGGTLDVAGGSGGAGGAGAGSGATGSAGSAGTAGTTVIHNILTDTYTVSVP